MYRYKETCKEIQTELGTGQTTSSAVAHHPGWVEVTFSNVDPLLALGQVREKVETFYNNYAEIRSQEGVENTRNPGYMYISQVGKSR